MLMRGDVQKLIDQINPVFDNVFAQINKLEKRIEALEKAKDVPIEEKPKRKPGRPRKNAA